MEETITSLPNGSRFLVSRFKRQTYVDAKNVIDDVCSGLLTPQVSLETALNNTVILTPQVHKQIIFVDVPAAGTVRIRKPKNDCKEFLMVMKTPAQITINAFPSGTILPLMGIGQAIHSIRFVWDDNLLCWRSVKTT